MALRRCPVGVVVLMACWGLGVAAAGAGRAAALPARADTAAPAAAAVRLAAAQASALAASGQPVEVMADRTDWTQVFAEPTGGFEMVQSLVPVRVQRPDGSWVPVDPTLSARPDGSVAPAAITTGLSLSGGGAGPMFTLSQGGRSLAVSWPFGSLPAPALSGATTTYANVLPG